MRKKRLVKKGKCLVAGMLGFTMISTSIFTGGIEVTAAVTNNKETVTFKTQEGGVFDGMPLFDGNPDHLDEFVDTYFEYTGLEGPAVYVTGSRNHYTLQQGENVGKVIPGALSAANDGQGVSTDFPALVGMGQTWNKELIYEIGDVIGNEKISTLKAKQGESNIHGGSDPSLSVAFTVISDIRINPLNGRFDEGFTEDPYLSSVMVDNLATGIGGTAKEESEDGFWMRAAVSARHYSVYNSQWFRQNAENSAGARAIYEYHAKPPLTAFEKGTLAGVMTSFGSTNGIPNIISPYQTLANRLSKYGVYSSPDFNADARVFEDGSFGNGYDTKYAADRTHATVLMALAEANAGRPSPSDENAKLDVLALVDAIEQGLYGITKEDLIEAARPHVNQMVRIGLFNETDENGIPINYPFAPYAKDVSPTLSNYNDPKHQEIALQAARESIVLLKNDGTLPLAKDSKAAVSGIYADSRFKTTYSVAATPKIDNAGLTPLNAIIKKIGGANVTFNSGAEIIALRAKQNDHIVTVDSSEEGADLYTTNDLLDESNLSQLFEVYDWGQEGKSLRSLVNNRWVTSPANADSAISNTDATLLNLTNNDWDGALLEGDTSTIPPRLRLETNEDGTTSIITNGYLTGFGGNYPNWYNTRGRLVSVTEEGKLATSADVIQNAPNAENREDNVKFEEIVVKTVGEEAAARATEDDYAIVVVGAIPRHSAGEGYDRSSIYMGEDDYELIEKVSQAFAEQGKKTVVVVTASFPVGMDRIQNNENVSAIVYMPYAGQYDSFGLAEVLYGDYAPTGRLSSTWYADMSALPALNTYSIPEGQSAITLDDVDPRYTVDMTNADPIESRLTYMYTEAPVTYEFGYGLSYSEFEYGNLSVPASVNANETFQVSIPVTNTGTINTSEVVQLYVKNTQSAYGEYTPKKQLAAFEKVEIAPGETKTVTLTVNPKDLMIWDVNRGEFIVETGQYAVMVGSSSEDIRAEKNVMIQGSTLQTLNSNTFSVFDHSFAADEVIYNEVSKGRTASNLRSKKIAGGYYAVRSKQEGAWVAIPKVSLSNLSKVTASVAAKDIGGQITLHAGSPENDPFATIDVPITEPITYTIDNTEVSVTELGYVDVETSIERKVSGVHDMYIVFHNPDLRVDSLSFTRSTSNSSNDDTGIIIEPEKLENENAVVVNNPIASSDGSIKLELSDEKTELLVRADASELDGKNSLIVLSDAGEINIPGSLINQLKALADVEQLKGGWISFEFKALESNITDNLLSEASELNYANVKVAGDIYDLSLKLVLGDGNELKLTTSTFTEPVTIKLKAGSTNPDWTGIFYVTDTGGLTYIDSTRTDDWLSGEVWHFSKYAVLEYEKRFDDISASYWAYDAIKRMAAKQIARGINATQFAPTKAVTRAEFAALLVRALGLTGNGSNPFQDVPSNSWYAEDVSAAYEAGIIQGKTSDKFAPEAEITREEMAVMVIRAYEKKYGKLQIQANSAGFDDQDLISAWAQEAINLAVEIGLLQGRGNNQFVAKGLTNRAESIQVIDNLLN